MIACLQVDEAIPIRPGFRVGRRFYFVYFMRAQRDYIQALRAFSKEVSAPDNYYVIHTRRRSRRKSKPTAFR